MFNLYVYTANVYGVKQEKNDNSIKS